MKYQTEERYITLFGGPAHHTTLTVRVPYNRYYRVIHVRTETNRIAAYALANVTGKFVEYSYTGYPRTVEYGHDIDQEVIDLRRVTPVGA